VGNLSIREIVTPRKESIEKASFLS
jgi:hypothetical protein